MSNLRIYTVKKGETINMEWLKQHPDIDCIHGSTWDIENEKNIPCANIDNPFSNRYKRNQK